MRFQYVLLGLSTLTFLQASNGFCNNGLEGVQQSDICCEAQCGTCGESDCNEQPGGEDSCCAIQIKDSGRMCSSTSAAPCIIDDYDHDDDDHDDDDHYDDDDHDDDDDESSQSGGGHHGHGTKYEVTPGGHPFSLTKALAMAGPGDTIALSDGTYREPIVTMNAGTEHSPLVIKGDRSAIISAFSGNRTLMWSQKVVDIRHSWITLEGFTIDGHLNGLDEEEDYVDKCIFVEGQDAPTDLGIDGTTVKSSLIGFHMRDMYIHNCGMECIRMRNYVTNAVITNNEIEDCGIYDYQYTFDGKVGEAIYIGTSSTQWTAGEGTRITNGPDGSNYNLISDNKITPRGNECVDVKEGASFNVIEYNDCKEQLDDKSGCYDSRGNENTFRYNSGEDCDGAGVRLGGHVVDGLTYGVDNHVYGNHFANNGYGSIKAMQHPQGVICENTCIGDCEVREQGDDDEIEASWMEDCPDDLPSVPFIDE